MLRGPHAPGPQHCAHVGHGMGGLLARQWGRVVGPRCGAWQRGRPPVGRAGEGHPPHPRLSGSHALTLEPRCFPCTWQHRCLGVAQQDSASARHRADKRHRQDHGHRDSGKPGTCPWGCCLSASGTSCDQPNAAARLSQGSGSSSGSPLPCHRAPGGQGRAVAGAARSHCSPLELLQICPVPVALVALAQPSEHKHRARERRGRSRAGGAALSSVSCHGAAPRAGSGRASV